MSVGDRCRALREEKGLSQRELAEQCGMAQNDISKLEGGRTNFGPERLSRLADALEVEVSDLVVQGSEADQRSFTQDHAPKSKTKPPPKKADAPRVGILPLQKQLEFPYMILSNMTAQKLPATSRALAAQAVPCAAAWDNFLLRYPALREKIETGMIATDIVALLMAHIPIIQAAREETERLHGQANWDASDADAAAAAAA